MEYPGIETNGYGKALRCPCCENEETNYDGNHCIICGVMIQNKCTTSEQDMNGGIIDMCLDVLPGNARFCPNCGASSTFNENNLLKPWNEAKQEIESREDAMPF